MLNMAVAHAHPWRTGKSLFDILTQLPKFGVGRVVTRTRWQHLWPDQPSYYRITRVKIDCESLNLGQGEAWGIPTVKGYSSDGIEVRIGAWWKREWRLIRKSEEEEFCAYTPKETDFHQVPTKVPMPPLLAAMMKEERTSKGLPPLGEEGKPLLLDIGIRGGYRNRAFQIPEDELVGCSSGEFHLPDVTRDVKS
ncbi:small ribosomal subunit protein mS34-like [Diadema antillarum]|uniref:small ribosomal subunit protein mS34-like n=1 Tax=Diadema antillarum TaxID=105358 RepID=UPI003A897BC2